MGGTFVYVTHDQVEAMTMGSRIALLRDGAVQQFGTPREIYTDPANTFVARFIGAPAMNLIEASMADGEIHVGGQAFALPQQLARLANNRRVLLGLRPGALCLTTPDVSGALTGTVGLVEHIGDESVVSVRLDGVQTAHDEDGDSSGEILVTTEGYSGMRPGDVVGVTPTLEDAVLFSLEGGDRLR